MDTQLAFVYAGQPLPEFIHLGIGESNHVGDESFDALCLVGVLRPDEEYIPVWQRGGTANVSVLLSAWLLMSTQGLHQNGEPGLIMLSLEGEPGPQQVLRVQAMLRTHDDFQLLAAGCARHLEAMLAAQNRVRAAEREAAKPGFRAKLREFYTRFIH